MLFYILAENSYAWEVVSKNEPTQSNESLPTVSWRKNILSFPAELKQVVMSEYFQVEEYIKPGEKKFF